MNSKWNDSIFIGGTEVKNRIVYPPLSTNWATTEGHVTEEMLELYRDIAAGGCGMVVIAGTAISQKGKGSTHQLCLFGEEHLPGLKKLAAVLNENGCFSAIQIMHVGGQGNPEFMGSQAVAPSDYYCKAIDCSARAMTLPEILEVRDKFIKCAGYVKEAGYKAIEIHLSHGYLLHQFLSEYTNKRTDSYGGSILNRMRLPLEIIEGIKEKFPDLIIGVRISGEDYLENGINENVNKIMLPIFEKAGVEYFSVTAGVYDTGEIKHKKMKEGEFFSYSSAIKGIVSKPVIGVGKILDLDSAEAHLQANKCDMVAIGRAILSEPNLVNKVLQGKPYDKCIECHQCMYLKGGRPILSCPVSKLGIFKAK